jgi:hypothetical protein
LPDGVQFSESAGASGKSTLAQTRVLRPTTECVSPDCALATRQLGQQTGYPVVTGLGRLARPY